MIVVRSNGRVEPRGAVMVALDFGADMGSARVERCFTENISNEGARVATRSYWRRGDRVKLALSGGTTVVAVVTYCEPNSRDHLYPYCVGLRLLEPAPTWLLSLARP